MRVSSKHTRQGEGPLLASENIGRGQRLSVAAEGNRQVGSPERFCCSIALISRDGLECCRPRWRCVGRHWLGPRCVPVQLVVAILIGATQMADFDLLLQQAAVSGAPASVSTVCWMLADADTRPTPGGPPCDCRCCEAELGRADRHRCANQPADRARLFRGPSVRRVGGAQLACDLLQEGGVSGRVIGGGDAAGGDQGQDVAVLDEVFVGIAAPVVEGAQGRGLAV